MAEEKHIQFAESEDVARAKAFWHEHGKSMVFGVVLGLGGIIGFNYWDVYQQKQSEQASQLFDQLQSEESEIETVMESADQLKQKYGSTIYASLGALSLAKKLVEQEDYEQAEQQLDWILQNGKHAGVKHIARLRFASVLDAAQRYDEMLELIKDFNSGPFAGRYYELRGDAYAGRNAQGDHEKAREAYLSGLDALDGNSASADLIQLKLDNLSVQ